MISLDQKMRHVKKNEKDILSFFEQIYDTYHKLIYYVISKYVSNDEDIKELVNDVFLQFYNHMGTIVTSIKYYLVVSAKNRALDFLKKQKEIPMDSLLIINKKKSGSESYLKVKRILKQILEEKEIYIIEEHLFYDRKFKEIAKEKNESLNTIKGIYYRALRKVGNYYEQN